MNGKDKLKFKSNSDMLGVLSEAWQNALTTAQPDPVAGIRHAPIAGDGKHRTHVAAIPQKVNCHFHAHGEEEYAVVSGSGTLHWGKVTKTADGYIVKWETPIDVIKGDSFSIPEGYAHQLAKKGGEDLVIVFGCPDAHLDDTQDRTLLPDAATLENSKIKKLPKLRSPF